MANFNEFCGDCFGCLALLINILSATTIFFPIPYSWINRTLMKSIKIDTRLKIHYRIRPLHCRHMDPREFLGTCEVVVQ